nr:protein NATD1 [Neodiprion pinetum]
MLRLSTLITARIKSAIRPIGLRYLYGVNHDPGVFYVKLHPNDRAVLLYKQNDRVLDMYAVEVPKKHEGKGLGRLLAETAFIYVIVRNYRMHLTCTYLQRYYETIKTQQLSAYVVGPPHLLTGPHPVAMFPTVEADKLEGMPDPTDTKNRFNKD